MALDTQDTSTGTLEKTDVPTTYIAPSLLKSRPLLPFGRMPADLAAQKTVAPKLDHEVTAALTAKNKQPKPGQTSAQTQDQTPSEQVQKAHAQDLMQQVYLGHIKLENITKTQWDALSTDDKGLLRSYAFVKRQELPFDDDDDQTQPGQNKHWLLLGAEAAGAGTAAEFALHHFRYHRHRLRLLWKLLVGKKVETYARRERNLTKEEREAAAAERKAADASRAGNEASELNEGAQANKEVSELTRTGRTGEEVLEAEHALAAGRNLEKAGASLRTATEATEALQTVTELSRITRMTRKGGVAGLIGSLLILPATAAMAYAKTMPENASTQDIIGGALKAGSNTFLFLNKDWLTAFGKGDVKDGLDKFFGISDSIRLIKLAHDNPEQFKKEVREMADGATKFGEWAKNNPEKLNKLLEDPEKFMNDPRFAKDVATAVHEGLDGNKNAASAKGLDALQRAQKISANGTYKKMGANVPLMPQTTAADPYRHTTNRNHDETSQPTEG